MLTTKEKNIIICVINHCERIEKTISGINKNDFDVNEDIKDIVCFNILQIGELAKNLSQSFTAKYNGAPWKDIKGMRDWVAHGYGTIDFDVIWKTASQDITHLCEYCEQIIENNK